MCKNLRSFYDNLKTFTVVTDLIQPYILHLPYSQHSIFFLTYESAQ